MKRSARRPLGVTRLIALGFLAVIALGTGLLMLPFSAKNGQVTPFANALFTASSAACVTGLTVYDTFSHWSFFGQAVIISLIQIGGLGFVTVMALFARLLRRKVSLRERLLIQQSAGALTVGDVGSLVKKVILATAAFEGAGTVLLAIRLCPKLGFFPGLWSAFFHSVSAFCNAGFDIFGRTAPGTSLISVSSDPVIMLTLSLLIIFGGIGFLVWSDLFRCRLSFKRLRLHSKLALVTTGALLTFGFVFFTVTEWNGAFAGMGFFAKLLQGFFCSVTVRTAGFFTLDLTALSTASLLIMCALMFIGGSPGSTAGGTKTTTHAVIFASVIATVRRKNSVTALGRRISEGSVRLAGSVCTVYIVAIILFTSAISLLESTDLMTALFEVTSAMGTVGLSLGLTSTLCVASKLIISFLMFAGRVGGLSLALVITEKRDSGAVEKPEENVLIG